MSASVGTGQAEAWFVVRGGGLTIDGCDLVGTGDVRFLLSGGGPLHLRRCRLLRCRAIGAYEQGPGVRLEDCFIYCFYGLEVVDPAARVEVTNCIAVVLNHLLSFPGGGGLSVRLQSNTFDQPGGVLAQLAVVPGQGARPVTLDLAHNLVAGMGVGWGRDPSLLWVTATDWRPHLRWRGHDNLYEGSLQPPLVLRDPKAPNEWTNADAAAWDKMLAGEQGSHRVERVLFAWNDLATPSSPAALAALPQVLAEARRQSRRADVGPDLVLLGPGAAYLKALAKASGKPVPQERLRPEAEEGGPFVLRRDGQVVRGWNTLQEAFDAAAGGDVIEVRTDGPRPAGTVPAGKGSLTLRAAPGYRPVLTGYLPVMGKDELTVEGLTFRDGLGANPNEDARIVRVANCSIENGLVLNTAGGKPAEVVNSLVTYLQCYQRRGGKVTLRGSVVNTLDLLPQEDEPALVLERSAVWHPDLGLALRISGRQQKGTPSVTARATLFEAGAFLVAPSLQIRWAGSHNVYRVGSLNWHAGKDAWGLAGWRKLYQTAEEGSVEADPLISDPLQWRPRRDEGVAKSPGADVERVAGPAATPARADR
jgi:hypothetical protein